MVRELGLGGLAIIIIIIIIIIKIMIYNNKINSQGARPTPGAAAAPGTRCPRGPTNK